MNIVELPRTTAESFWAPAFPAKSEEGIMPYHLGDLKVLAETIDPLGATLTCAYAFGSRARQQGKPGESDLDLIACVTGPLLEEDDRLYSRLRIPNPSGDLGRNLDIILFSTKKVVGIVQNRLIQCLLRLDPTMRRVVNDAVLLLGEEPMVPMANQPDQPLLAYLRELTGAQLSKQIRIAAQ